MSLNTSIGPKVVPPTPPGISASYDYFDVAEGTGIINFYAAQTIASGAIVVPFLTTDEGIYSGRIAEKVIVGNAAPVVVSDLNYDVVFQRPKLIADAKVRISVSQGANVATSAYVTLKFKLLKVSNGVETQIGDQAETNHLSSVAAGTQSTTENVDIDPGKRIHFRQGDALRLNIVMTGGGGAATAATGYGVDPKDRDDVLTASGAIIMKAANTTQLKVSVPFVIDI